jgi:urease accessory protein
MQLVSPALPVGAFNFSQGLETAVEAGWVCDPASALDWISGLAGGAVGTLDLPILLRLHAAWGRNDREAATRWSQRLIAARDTAELRAEDRHMGSALAKILAGLSIPEAEEWIGAPHASFAALFALAASRWQIAAQDAASGYLWAWCENQVLAAVKLVPLGQTAGQALLDALVRSIPGIVSVATTIADERISISAPRLAIASARHETQYTRLFKS